jgi:hypothetical protein
MGLVFIGSFIEQHKTLFMKRLLALVSIIILTACKRDSTNDPVACYQYWAGEKPGSEVRVIHGQYGPTSRWTKDYEIYLQLNGSEEYISAIVRKNNLIQTTGYIIPDDAPSWFKPGKKYRIWKPSGLDQASFYLYDPAGNNIFIYQVSL